MTDYTFKTEPYAHQRTIFEASKDRAYCAYLMEMGVGKSKVCVDVAAYQYEIGRIDAILVVAPAGVHANWIDREVPAHLPDRVERRCVTWRSGRMETVAARAALVDLLAAPSLAVLAMNVDALITPAGRRYVERFLGRRRVFMVIDESVVIKAPGSQRCKAAIALGRRAVARRICSGAPITQGIFDLYSQFNFLDRSILGFGSFLAFKHRYGEWEEGYNRALGRTYPVLKGYRNQDELLGLLAPYSYRLTKEECLDLPPKVYERRTFALAPEQRRLYDSLKEKYVAELSDRSVTVAHALTRVLRLQQVASDHWPETQEAAICAACDGDGCAACGDLGLVVSRLPARSVTPDGRNPRLAALLAVLDEVAPERGVIIWCRFLRDIEDVIGALPSGAAVRYSGSTPAVDRTAAVDRFQAGDARYFVGTPAAGGRGLTLTAASVVVFYSHGWSYEQRLQAEDRCHRIGQTRSVTYVDLVAEDTVDERLMEVIAAKGDLAKLFDRDRPAALLAGPAAPATVQPSFEEVWR